MDDLDALLADLQTTTRNISNSRNLELSQEAQVTNHYATPLRSPPSQQTHQHNHTVVRESSDSPPPPPLPPPPSQDVLDSLNGVDHLEPLYEPQQVFRPAVQPPVNSPKSPGYKEQESPNYHQISPSSPIANWVSPASPRQYSPRQTSPDSPYKKKKTPPPVPVKPGQGQPGMSSLSSNLSELDILLQDLNSAQFMAEVDKRNSANRQPVSPGAPASTPSKSPERPFNDMIHHTDDDLEDPGYSTVQPEPQHYNVVNNPRQHTHSVPPVQTVHSGPAASTATKELDDLMASLSSFKVDVSGGTNAVSVATGNEPLYAKPNKSPPLKSTVQAPRAQSQLDTMLGNLQTDMSKQGVTTREKGKCAACDKPIVGQVITALGKIWHPEHFTCTECHSELGTKNFFERDGKPFCERDYHNLFSPKCSYCSGPILDKCVTALGSTWHPEHFFCAECGRAFDDEGFHEKDGKAFCREDYFDMFAPKCGGCNRPIMDNYISALNKQWHPECFVCRDCGMSFNGGSFFDHEGLPYCETHYHAKRGSLCAGCQKPITGRCITAMYKKFHPEHFVCAFCLKQLNKGTFKEQNDKPYCHSCFVKLFG